MALQPHSHGSLEGALFISAAVYSTPPTVPVSFAPHWYGAPQMGGAPAGRNSSGSSFHSAKRAEFSGSMLADTMVR